MGWTFPWASSFGSDFNYDYAASIEPEQLREGSDYNFAPTGDRTALLSLQPPPAGRGNESCFRPGALPHPGATIAQAYSATAT